MNKLLREMRDFVDRFVSALSDSPSVAHEIVLAPSATHLALLGSLLEGKTIRLGAQNCGMAKSGPYTGEISPAVLKELNVDSVIIGHSERRHVFLENDAVVLSRLKAGLEEGLKVVLCVGEVLQDRKVGKTFKVVETQLSILKQTALPSDAWKHLMIAYEPVWAIGTGENATPQQAQDVHSFIRGWVKEKFNTEVAGSLQILYGGSVKPDNSTQIMAQKDVDGLLVGTSSLDPAVFAGVIKNGLKPRN